MKKMNIEIVELEENYENTKFCGADLLEPCTDVEKVFAPQRYVVEGGDMYKSAFVRRASLVPARALP